jgi:hypothetical protein
MIMHTCETLVRGLGFALVGLVSLSLASCSDVHTRTITGTVTIDGKPVPWGDVNFSFNDASHTARTGAIQLDGKYKVTGCPLADAVVTIMVKRQVPVSRSGGFSGLGSDRAAREEQEKDKENAEAEAKSKVLPRIPEGYGDPRKMWITFGTRQTNPFDIQLDSKKR